MNSDDYAKKQTQRDAQYEREYEAWVKSMSREERQEAEKLGLLKPCLQRHGNGAPDHDMAESSAASHTPDIAALVDGDEESHCFVLFVRCDSCNCKYLCSYHSNGLFSAAVPNTKYNGSSVNFMSCKQNY